MQLSMAVGLGLIFALAGSAQATLLQTSPDVAGKVKIEAQENFQIHDSFAEQEESDEARVKAVRANKDLSALQVSSSPDVAGKVAIEAQENLQIHDSFAEQQKGDEEVEKFVKANKDLSALQTVDDTFLQVSSSTSPDVSAEVAIEAQENLQIHDSFAEQQKKDEKVEQTVKANKDLSALQVNSFLQVSSATSPDVSAEVAIEAQENLQIHDSFAEQQKKDEKVEQTVKANKDLSALQVKASPKKQGAAPATAAFLQKKDDSAAQSISLLDALDSLEHRALDKINVQEKQEMDDIDYEFSSHSDRMKQITPAFHSEAPHYR